MMTVHPAFAGKGDGGFDLGKELEEILKKQQEVEQGEHERDGELAPSAVAYLRALYSAEETLRDIRAEQEKSVDSDPDKIKGLIDRYYGQLALLHRLRMEAIKRKQGCLGSNEDGLGVFGRSDVSIRGMPGRINCTKKSRKIRAGGHCGQSELPAPGYLKVSKKDGEGDEGGLLIPDCQK
jgi:hypothetical protein